MLTVKLAGPHLLGHRGKSGLCSCTMMTLAATDLASYLPLFVVIMMAITFSAANIVLTLMLGPKRDGDIKSIPYESGMNPIGTARKRFNVRFYLIAMVFLVFDVEVVSLGQGTYPGLCFELLDGLLGGCHN